jgi:hypothetical protein
MSIQEAKSLIVQEIAKYRQISYKDLLHFREEVDTYEVSSLSAEVYQIEVQAFWDSGKPGNLRVMVSIDGGGIPAWRPLTNGFILSPDGKFIGE